MKTTMRFFCMLLALLLAGVAFAQKKQELPTKYEQNKKAIVTLTSGKQVTAPNSNIFMKDASLLYFQGNDAKSANMSIVASVEFDDKKYINIENQLAYFVDSIKGNSLYCVELIDLKAWKQNLINNRNFTHIDFSSERLETYADNFVEHEDRMFPVIYVYYFYLDGKFVLAHDRDLWVVLNKERHRLMKTAISDPNFSWTDPASLMKLLKMISI